jgi:hypothetical protein
MAQSIRPVVFPTFETMVQTGRDYDLTVGPAVSWIVARNLGRAARNLQLQALIGLAQPKKTHVTAAVGILSASIDF